MIRPSLNDITALLQRHGALIVHFSGAPPAPTLPDPPMFPDDLRRVVAGLAQTGISCSTVMPGDRFDGPDRHATGCIGVVVRPLSPDSLMDVHADDLGSYMDDGHRQTGRRDLAVADLERSITARMGYNEWVVRDYTVIGIFAQRPFDIWANIPAPPELPDYLTTEPLQGLRRTDLATVSRLFPAQPVFTFIDNSLARYADGVAAPVNHAELYPAAPDIITKP